MRKLLRNFGAITFLSDDSHSSFLSFSFSLSLLPFRHLYSEVKLLKKTFPNLNALTFNFVSILDLNSAVMHLPEISRKGAFPFLSFPPKKRLDSDLNAECL